MPASLTLPSSGLVGQPLSFATDPLDAFSGLASTSWSFGDGGAATGNSVTHAYGVPGTYAVNVTAAATLGNTASMTRTLTIAQSPTLVRPIVVQQLAAPVLSRLSLSPPAFRAAPAGPSVVAARVRFGTVIAYIDSPSATTTFTVERRMRGVKRGPRCVSMLHRRAHRHQRRCVFLRTIGSFSHQDTAARNRLRFSGRIKGTRLAPSRYVLKAQAHGAKSTSSSPRYANFRVKR